MKDRNPTEVFSFIAALLAGFCWLGYCIGPLLISSFSKHDGSWVINFHSSAIYTFISFSILFYAAVSWRQKKFNKSLIVSIYSIVFSYGY